MQVDEEEPEISAGPFGLTFAESALVEETEEEEQDLERRWQIEGQESE